MGAEVPARGSLGTALRAQASLVPLRQSHRLSALLGRRKGRGVGHHPHFTRKGLDPGKWRVAASVERHVYTQLSYS